MISQKALNNFAVFLWVIIVIERYNAGWFGRVDGLRLQPLRERLVLQTRRRHAAFVQLLVLRVLV